MHWYLKLTPYQVAVVSSNTLAYYEGERPNKGNSFVEKLEPGFFDNEVLHLIVGTAVIS